MSSKFPSRRFCTDSLGSTNMAVNGSVTPVSFTVQPSAGTIFTAFTLIFNAYGSGNLNNPLDFWSFPALTNGIGNEIRSNGITTPLATAIRNNFDLIQYIGAEFLGKTIGATNLIRGEFNLTYPLVLNGDRGDFFRMVVRDDLTTGAAIGQMTVSLKGTTTTF